MSILSRTKGKTRKTHIHREKKREIERERNCTNGWQLMVFEISRFIHRIKHDTTENLLFNLKADHPYIFARSLSLSPSLSLHHNSCWCCSVCLPLLCIIPFTNKVALFFLFAHRNHRMAKSLLFISRMDPMIMGKGKTRPK